MSQLQKLMERIRNNPKTVRFDELEKILLRAGYKCRQTAHGSSHYTYYKEGKMPLTIPKKHPFVKEIYVKNAIEALEED